MKNNLRAKPEFKLLLANDDGEVLETWRIGVIGRDFPDNEKELDMLFDRFEIMMLTGGYVDLDDFEVDLTKTIQRNL